MLQNRSKFSQSNHRNSRKRNRRNADQPTESSSSSHESEMSSEDYSSSEILFDDSSDSLFEDESVSPVIGRRLNTRRKRLSSKSKRNNKVIHNRNRSSRPKKKPVRATDPQAAGPSRINNNRRTTRSENSNTRTAKRKYKDRSDDSETSIDEFCNTSSEEFEGPLFRIKKKRPRHTISNTSESDDSEVQPALTRRRTLLDSESSTSASEEITTNGRIRNGRMPLWTDSNSDSIEFNTQETSTAESSGSSAILNPRRRRRPIDYFGMSDSSGSSLFSTDSDLAHITSVLDSEASSSYNTAQSTSSNTVERNSKDQTSDSDSSDSDGEKCAICLKKFRKQLIGNPSNCDHNFCLPCLKKWSENSTTCPVDRSTFDSITVRSEINGPVIEKMKVENRNFGVFPPLDIDEVLVNDAINCEICGSGDDEETLLLCDLCNLGYHMACLRPPLSAIPAGAWYCPPCVDLRIDPTRNVNEGFSFYPDFPMGSLFLLSSARRPNRIRTNNSRSRPNGPLPRGRGPTRGSRSQNLSNPRLQNFSYVNFSNVMESVIADLNAETSSQNRRRRKRRNRQTTSTNPIQQLTTAQNSERTTDPISRITRKVNQRMSRNSIHIPRPRGPQDVVDMVFPSFSLFGGEDFDYYSDGPDEQDLEGEVAIMARVRNEYSTRRLGNRKNIVTSLNNFHDRSRATSLVSEITESASSVNLLDTILESQTLWHSKNVEIKSKKDGTLEIKRKDEQNKKPDLTNSNHSSKEIPLFPNKGDGASDNKSYANSNNRYSSLGNSSGSSSNSFSSSTSSFNSLNPSTRPGFSNLLGNNPTALDLSPFRGAAPIRFRMNAPRPMMRRQNYNSNSQRPPSNSPANMINSVQSPKKSSNVSNNEEDVDLYDDIETENVESEKSQEMFASLEPPPEPPALLIGSDSSTDDEDNGLVIDDKVVNKSNIYDPNEPNEDSDTENNQDKNSNIVPGYLRSPSYGGLSEFGPHLPLPEPPVPAPELRMELDSIKDSDEEEEAECPNMTLYSSTSMNLANNVQDIPIPDAAYPQEVLECIRIPTPGDDSNTTKEDNATKTDSKLYSPTDRNDSETSSIAEVQITSPKKQSPKRRDSSEISSVTSRDSSREHSDRSSAEESDRSEHYEKDRKRGSRRRSKDIVRRRRRSSVDKAPVIDLVKNDKPSKEIDLTEVDSNDEKDATRSDDESVDDAKTDTEENIDKYDIAGVCVDKDEEDNKSEKSDDEKEADETGANDAVSVKSVNEDYKTASEDEDKEAEPITVVDEADKEKPAEDVSVDTSLEAENIDTVPEKENANAASNDVNASGNYLLPSEDLDPVSDVEYNDFPECQRSSSIRDKRKKRKKTRRRDSSTDNKTAAEAKELEEGEIEEEKSKRKFSSQKKKGRSETPERSPDRRLKKKRDRKEKTTGKENKETGTVGKSGGGANADDLQWKKLSKNTKERNYRDGKAKPNDKSDKARDREIKSRKEKRKEIERYDVRKIVSERPVRDEFGRDVSANRSRSRTRSRSISYSGRRRSKGNARRSFSQGDRMIDWSPVRNQQRRSRSRTRRTRSRSRNRSRLSGDRYRNRSKNRDREREYDKREPRKRKRSLSSEIEKYASHPVELKKRHRSRDRSRKSTSYNGAPLRPSGRERDMPAEFYYERSRSWSRSLSYASLTPEPEQYIRYSRSPSIIEPPIRIPLVSPDRGHEMNMQNQQNLTVIVPNVDLSKKKHKKKKDSKKKKKKQPSKEVFTSGDNIVVSVNFDDNQKIISAKSSKRKHDDEKGRKKKKDETRKKRKQTLQVSEEVLNAKPVAVIDLNSSPCKEMSPTEVISLTDSGDEATVIIENAIPTDRRIASSQEDTGKSPGERRAYVMTQSGPKTPPEPPIKFTVNSAAAGRPLPTNPIFEQDEIDGEDAMHYNKGPNTPPEPANQTRRSRSPSTTMYDPFEPTKSRSQSPENAQYDERKDTTAGVAVEERRPVIDMFSEDNDKPTAENQSGGASAEKSKPQEDAAKETNTAATPTKSSTAEDAALSTNTKSPAKDAAATESANESTQPNGVNTLVLDLSSLGDDFVPKSTIPLVKTSQGKYEFQSGKAPDKPITVVISQQSQPAKPQPQQVMVTPTRQVPTKPVEPMKQPVFPDLLSWKLPPPMSQTNFSTPPPTSSSLPSGNLVTPSKSAPGLLTQNGNQEDNSFEVDDSPYSPASSEGDDLFEPPPLNASTSSPNKQRPSPMPAVNSYKSRVDALFSSSPNKKVPPRGNVPPHMSKPVSAIKGTKKILKPPPPIPSNKKDMIRADEEQLKILDDVPNSAVEMMVKEKFLKKLHRQERVVEEVKVVLKPHYAKKHITKEEYKDILRKAVPKICHNKSGDINPSKIQGLVEAYVKKIRHAKKKPTMGAGAPLFPPMKTTGKKKKPQKTLWG